MIVTCGLVVEGLGGVEVELDLEIEVNALRMSEDDVGDPVTRVRFGCGSKPSGLRIRAVTW